MASEQQNLITQKHWKMVLDAIPEINHDGAQEDFQLLFRHSRLNAGDILPAKGLYVVIAGAVSLKLNNEELMKAGPLDYFYEEYLLLDELNVEVSATALANTEVAFLSKENWDTLEAKKRERCLSVFFGDLINIHKHGDFIQNPKFKKAYKPISDHGSSMNHYLPWICLVLFYAVSCR